MGQYIQDGKRTLFETVVLFDKPKYDILIENSPEDVDGLNFLQGKSVSYVTGSPEKRLKEQYWRIMTAVFPILLFMFRIFQSTLWDI